MCSSLTATKTHKRVQAMTYAQAELLVNLDPDSRSNSLPSGVQAPEGKKKGKCLCVRVCETRHTLVDFFHWHVHLLFFPPGWLAHWLTGREEMLLPVYIFLVAIIVMALWYGLQCILLNTLFF